jgi:signal transduction histidine kinase/imidazolonepropionase-like amidohydrolase
MTRQAIVLGTLLAIGGVGHAGGKLLVRNARLIDGTGAAPRDGVSIQIEAGRIAAIGADLASDGGPVLDAGGATVLPGLIDAHVHLSYVSGADLRGDSPDQRRALGVQQLRAYVACGVTTVLDAGIGTDDALAIEHWVAAGNPGPRFLTLGPGFFTPGGFMSPPIPGVADVADVERVFEGIVAAHGIGAGVMLEHGWIGVPRWPIHSPEMRTAIVRGATARGLPIYVHATSEDDQTVALEMGAHALLQSPQYRREELSAGFIARMARSGTYQMTGFASADGMLAAHTPARFDDPLVRLVVPSIELATARDPAVLETVTLDMATRVLPWLPHVLRRSVARATMSETSARFALAASQRAVRRLHDAGVPIVVGTETAGGPYDLHGPATLREIELLGGAGFTPAEAIAAATRVPARMLGLDAEIGTVAVGKRADLVIVRDDPLADLRALRTVRFTVKDGVAHTPGEWMGVAIAYEPPAPFPADEVDRGFSATALGMDPNVVAGAYALTTLLWALLTVQAWRIFRRGPRTGPVSWMPPMVCALMTTHYLVPVFLTLAADTVVVRAPHLLTLGGRAETITFLATMPMFRHLLAAIREPTPGRRWLAVNYGTALLTAAVVVFPRLVPAPTAEMRELAGWVLHIVYMLVMGVLILRELRRLSRPGVWRPGSLGDARSTDIVILSVGLFVGAATLFLVVTGGAMSVWNIALNLAAGLVLVTPFAIRVLGEMIRGFLLVIVSVAITGAVYFGVPIVTAGIDPGLRRVVELSAVVGLALVLVGGQQTLRRWIDRLVFRRSRRRQAELREFLHGLAAELGTAECCRRALAEIVRVMRFRGAAIVLRGGETFSAGDVALDTLGQVWPRGDAADALPASPLIGWYELHALAPALREALAELDVVGVLPIATPRRRWGHLLVSAGVLAADFAEEDVQATRAFADQLALVVAGAELLARTIAVERMLAHREKLAAIGELAARVAHEIRNPVTAARSLAQQLSRAHAGASDAEAAALILTELERVERQVATLLRFARRDEFHFAPVDLGSLARATVDDLRPRLDAAGIGVEVVTVAVIARADAEKIRQVLVNLVENAIDALADATVPPHLSVVVGRHNGSAAVRVSDNGPGVPADAMPHLFEPFFSRKANGTGLGLAIAKRTVDAHGGRIDAVSPPQGGTTFAVELPLA